MYPSVSELVAGVKAFQTTESRDAMYKVATFLVGHFWGRPTEMADGLGVLLLTWNQAFYRYGPFDFDDLETCITDNLDHLVTFRQRDIDTYARKDDPEISRLFGEFLSSLGAKKDGVVTRRSPVAVSKALHLLAPAYFPLWDSEIAKAYGCSYGTSADKKYIRFLRIQRDILARLHLNAGEIESLGADKTRLKLLDEYNYSKFTKNWI
jgi:hypothetical protein